VAIYIYLGLKLGRLAVQCGTGWIILFLNYIWHNADNYLQTKNHLHFFRECHTLSVNLYNSQRFYYFFKRDICNHRNSFRCCQHWKVNLEI
jgi:hypothetical protein